MSPEEAAATALACFHSAWQMSIEDYQNKKINAEACLQAAQYFHLRNELATKGDFSIFVECAVKLSEEDLVFFDTLVVHNGKVVLAVELKYRPKGKPTSAEVTADLNKLSFFRKWSKPGSKLSVLLRRYLTSNRSDVVEMTVAPTRRLVFAAFVQLGKMPQNEKDFWSKFGPLSENENWARRGKMPIKLSICLAQADADGTAVALQYGGKHTLPVQ